MKNNSDYLESAPLTVGVINKFRESIGLPILFHDCDFSRCWDCEKNCPYKDYRDGNMRFD